MHIELPFTSSENERDVNNRITLIEFECTHNIVNEVGYNENQKLFEEK